MFSSCRNIGLNIISLKFEPVRFVNDFLCKTALNIKNLWFIPGKIVLEALFKASLSKNSFEKFRKKLKQKKLFFFCFLFGYRKQLFFIFRLRSELSVLLAMQTDVVDRFFICDLQVCCKRVLGFFSL